MTPHAQPDGYLAAPSSNGKSDVGGAGVLVLHAWWGLNNTIKSFCTQLAHAGFTAFAPDLYRGKTASTIADAKALSGNLDADRARSDVLAAAEFLRDHADVTRRDIAVIGFSLGVWFALEVSVTNPDLVRAVVIFYGTRPGDYSRSRSAYLGHFAQADEFEPDSEVDVLETALRSAGRPVTFHRYPGTGHWFFEPDRPDAYDHAAASLAWQRTLVFLRSYSQG